MKIISIVSLSLMLLFVMLNTEDTDDIYVKMAQLIIGLLLIIPLVYVVMN